MTLEQALAIIEEQRRVIAEQRRVIAEQQATIAKLEARITELEKKLGEREDENEALAEKANKDSQNSSLPPSSDRPWQSKQAKDKKPKTKRKRGGQKGHKGHHRQLLPSSQVDHVQQYRPSRCKACHEVLSGHSVGDPYRVQVTELPKVQVEVHEHQALSLRCKCGTVTRAALPKDVVASAFGSRMVATVSLLTSSYRLSKRQVVSLMALWGASLSSAMVCRMERRMSGALQPIYEEARKAVSKEQGPLHADETTWKEQGKRVWLWVVSGRSLKVFRIARGRTMEVAKGLVGAFQGILCSDRFGGYRFYPMEKRQVCWAHLKRDFTAFLERRKAAKEIGEALLVEVNRMFRLWHFVRDGTLTRERFVQYMRPVQARILRRLRQGRSCACKKTAGTCREVLKYRKALWSFVSHEGVEPTNNQAERDIRHSVIWRRISHGTQSPAGSLFVERMLTVVASLKAQERDVMAFLLRALDPPDFRLPSLIPTAQLEHSESPLETKVAA